jgi:hypothetical protein
MLLRFDSGGGVTGPAGNRSASFDTNRMSADEAAELQALVQAADLPRLVGRVIRAPARPDEMYYEITFEGDGPSQTVSATQQDMPSQLRPLINWLNARAQAKSHP